MSTTKVKTTTTKKVNGITPVKKTQQTTPVKVMKIEPEKKVVNITDILREIEKAERTKKYYGKIKVKQQNLEVALKRIEQNIKEFNDEFSEENDSFPFGIDFYGINNYKNKEVIFSINMPQTVKAFAEILLAKISEKIALFESELQEHYSKIK